MAPTAILATQHLENYKKMFNQFGIKCELLISAITKKKKQELLERLESGEIDILIGTHAIIEENVKFKNLGLVVTDEQHRFGVKQRTKIVEKGQNPDVLVMTATPIPRTLALILYGDLDISIIDELPPNRKKIDTFAVKKGTTGSLYAEDQQKEHEGLCHRHLYRPDAYPQLRRTYSRPSGRRRPDWRERRLVHHLGHHRLPARQPPRGLGVCEPRQLEGRKAARPRRDEGDRGGRRPPRSRPHQALRAESLPARHVPHRPHRFRSHLLAVRHGGPCLHRHQLCRQLQHRPLHRHARHWLCSASVYA